MNNYFESIDLTQNPFPPAASGLGGILKDKAYIPSNLEEKIIDFYNRMSTNPNGVKIFPVVGEYGSGKTAVLYGYLRFFFEENNIKVIYFDNPGVEFYDLADTLMRSLGRYEFAKALWEMAKPFLDFKESQPRLFALSFDDYLSELKNSSDINSAISKIQIVLKDNLQLTDDEEVAAKLGKLVVETKKKTYFDARDFAPRGDSLVPPRQEARFFSAIVKSIIKIYNVHGVAFLIDEFEEIAISEIISKQKKYSYFTTMRRLIDFAEVDNLWIAVSMTNDAKSIFVKENPALWQRFSNNENSMINLTPFDQGQIKEWLIWWLNRYRLKGSKNFNSIFPFKEGFEEPFMTDASRRVPRFLVKSFFQILAEAQSLELKPDDFTTEFVAKTLDKIFMTHKVDHQRTVHFRQVKIFA